MLVGIPYGAIADPQVCDVYDNATSGCASGGACTLTPAGDLSACSVHGAGDLVGNAAEWVNACNGGGATGKCYFRGGSVTSGAPECRTRAELARDQVRPFLGFRCCDDDRWAPAASGGRPAARGLPGPLALLESTPPTSSVGSGERERLNARADAVRARPVGITAAGRRRTSPSARSRRA